jgi:hypothetical protein
MGVTSSRSVGANKLNRILVGKLLEKGQLGRLRNRLDRGSIHGRGGEGIVSLLHRVQIGPWTHSASYPMDTVGSFFGGKMAGL